MQKHLTISVVLLLLFSGCATTPSVPKIAQTRSGWPEAVFDNADANVVLNQLAESCMREGEIPTRTSNSVTCTMEPTLGEAMLAAANIGNKYSTSAIKKFRFETAQRPDGSFYMRCAITLSVTSPFGQEQEMGLYDSKNFNAVQKLFFDHGGHLPE